VKVTILAAMAAAVVSASAPAAIEPPTAAGDAALGTLHVTSGILVFPTSAELRGVWTDTKVACSITRRLRVRADVYYRPFGGTGSHRRRTGSFADSNCAEGGPNIGFTLTARGLGYACASGRWKPGRLDFVVHTTEPTRGLTATASLSWANRARC
jgi:hypothetical protein